MISIRMAPIFRKWYSFHLANGTESTLHLRKFAEMTAFPSCLRGPAVDLFFYITLHTVWPFNAFFFVIPSKNCLTKKLLISLKWHSVSENRIWITVSLHSVFWTNTLNKLNKLLKWRLGGGYGFHFVVWCWCLGFVLFCSTLQDNSVSS